MHANHHHPILVFATALVVAGCGATDNMNGTGSFRYEGWIDYTASDRGQR